MQEDATPPKSAPATTEDTIPAHGAAEVRLAQELRLHRIELEVQHEELRSTQVELETARDRFADLYELSPVPFITVTSSGIVLELNGAGARLLERPRAHAVGLPLVSMAGFGTAPLQAHLRECVHSPEPVIAELDLLPPSKQRCRVQLTSRSVRGPRGERLCLVAVTNVDAHKRTEERLRLLASAGASLLAAATLPEAVEQLTSVLVPTVADLCVLDLVVGGSDLRRRAAVRHFDPVKGQRFEDCEERWGTLPNVGFATLQALQFGRSQLLPMITAKYYESAAVDGEHLTTIVTLVLRSWAVVPLLDPMGGRPLGVLRLATSGVREPLDRDDVEFAEQIAQLGALGLAAASARSNLLTEAATRAESGRTAVRTLQQSLGLLGARGSAPEDVAAALKRANAAVTDLAAQNAAPTGAARDDR